MIRKNLKLLLTIFIIVIMSFSVSSLTQATDVKAISETAEATSISEETSENADETSTEEIHNGDLYLFDTKVIMDKLVDGNVFIFGEEVEIIGQVNGNLFVCANKLTFNNCYVRYSIFACANSVYYNGACNDLYVASSDIEMTYDSYVVRDVKSLSSNIKFKAAVGRDADLSFTKIELGEGEDIPIVYGNLRYSAPSEITIPEGVITDNGSVTYTNSSELDNNTYSIADVLIGFITCIITVLVIYIVIEKFTPNFVKKISNSKLSITKILKLFGIGLLSLVIVSILSILLLLTSFGAKLAFILILLFIILCLLATPIFSIAITNVLKPVLKLDKKPSFYLALCLVSIILYGVTLIPFIGGLFSFLIAFISIGLLIDIAIPHKELTDDEKAIIEEKKKQAKEEKEKRKQEKLEAKEAKKREKEDNSNL